MINYERLSKKEPHFHRLTGLSLMEFGQLYDKFYSAWWMDIRRRSPIQGRQRNYGGGKKSKLVSLKDKLLFILVYVRMYPLLFIQGLMFELSEGKTCLWVHRLLPILDEASGYTHKRPVRGEGKSLDEVLEEYPELRELGVLGDGMERPMKRPQDGEAQKRQYSGKKKRHTKKNIVLSHPQSKEIVYLGKTHEGSKNDKKCLDEEDLHCRGGPVPMGLDLGFVGYKGENIKTIMPKKKPKGKELTETEKEQNRAFSRIRIRVEHSIGGVKRNRSVADIYRNFKKNTDEFFLTIACGLHNLRVTHRHHMWN